MGGEEVFTSHPNKELLKIHDPEKFGCTPCHGGNGVALSSVEKAHGVEQVLALADASQGEHRGRLPAVPRARNRHGDGGHAESGPRDFPPARLHGLPSLRRLRPRGGRDRRREPADPPARAAEGRVEARDRLQRAEGQQPADQRYRGQDAVRARQRSEGALQRPGRQDRAARYALAQPGARSEEGRAEPEGSAHEAEEGMDSGLAEGSAPVARRHQDADLPAGR